MSRFEAIKLTITISLLILVCNSLRPVYAVGEGRHSKYRFMQARGVVLGQNEQPILVEITDTGEEIEIGELFGEFEGAFVMPDISYQSTVLLHDLELEIKWYNII